MAALEAALAPVVGADRIVAFPKQPTHTLAALETLESQIRTAIAGYPKGLAFDPIVDIEANAVRVAASNVGQAETLLKGTFGSQAPIVVHYQPAPRTKKIGSRLRISGKVRAGDELNMKYPPEEPGEKPSYGPCTANYGAFERAKKPGTGEYVLRMFLLTAGHCVNREERVWRKANPNPKKGEKQVIGIARRSGYESVGDGVIDTDATAIRLENPDLAPRQIFEDEHLPLKDITSIWSPTAGTRLCFSGRTSKERRCGPMIGLPQVTEYDDGEIALEACFEEYIWGGDSGSPVWVEGTGVAVGIAVSGTGGPNDPEESEEEFEGEEGEFEEEDEFEEAKKRAEEEEEFEEEGLEKFTCATLLKPYPNRNPNGTVFGSPDLAPLHLVTKTNAKN